MQDRGGSSLVGEKKPHITLTVGEQEEVMRVCHPEIKDKLDYDQVLPYLNSHLLLTSSDQEELDAMSRKDQKINWLVKSLPRKGSDAVWKLMDSLKCTVDGTAHGELISSLQQQVEKIKERRLKTVTGLHPLQRVAIVAVIVCVVGVYMYWSGYSYMHMDSIAIGVYISFLCFTCCGGLLCMLSLPFMAFCLVVCLQCIIIRLLMGNVR